MPDTARLLPRTDSNLTSLSSTGSASKSSLDGYWNVNVLHNPQCSQRTAVFRLSVLAVFDLSGRSVKCQMTCAGTWYRAKEEFLIADRENAPTNRRHSTYGGVATVHLGTGHLRDDEIPWWTRRRRRIFRKKTLFMRIPVLQWAPNYSREDVVPDIVAGLTVGVTVIPQALAYATIAGLPPEVNLLTDGLILKLTYSLSSMDSTHRT